MPTITNGTIEFERQLRPADYENKRAKVTLSFAVDDDDDPEAAMAIVADMAWAQVFKTLRKPERPKATKPPVAVVVKTDPETELARSLAKALDDEKATNDLEPEGVILPLVTDAEIDKTIINARGRGASPEEIKAIIFAATDVVGQSVKTLAQEKRPALIQAIAALHAAPVAEAAE